MLGVDPEFGASMLRLWIAAGSAVLLVLFCVLAVFQPQLRMAASPARRVGFVVAGAIFGAAIVWALLDHAVSGDANAERRALELRAQDLSTHALAPGSPLACLDAVAGESVETACEKALFVSPASVAAASSYVAARLTLLSNAERDGANIDDVLSPLRRALEADRFGFVAHVLAIRDGCTDQNCKALGLLRDSSRVRANLAEHALDRYLERYAPTWNAGNEAPIADASPPPAAAAQSGAPAAHKVVNVDFPSAASIPAVSIMNPEPTGPVVPGAAAAAAANPNPPPAGQAPSRHAHKPAAAPAAPPAPVGAQSAIPGSTVTEPIWPEPVPPPPTAWPPQTNAAPAAGAPVQLSPSSANASSGVAARAQ
jgi:hypothetical protein